MSQGPAHLQFSLKSLLLSMSLIGAGIGCFIGGIVGVIGPVDDYWDRIPQMVQILAGGPMIGAGIFVPFRCGRLGCYVGFFTPIVCALLYFFQTAPNWHQAWLVASRGEDRFIFMPVIMLTGFAILLGVFAAWRQSRRGRTNGGASSA